MNVTNIANLFHQNNIFQQNKPLGQKLLHLPAQDALNRLSENLLNAQKQTKDLKTRFDTLELSAEAVEGRKDSSLEEMPEGLLRFYLNQYKVGANLSQRHEASLTEYQDQLSAFDRTIQEYQDMLDGKTTLPDQMEMEDVSNLLEAARAAREQFLQQGAERLNRDSNPAQMGYMGKAYSMAGGRDDPHWQLDSSAGDIYGEVDRALAFSHDITSTFQKGASGILAELKRRGCVQAGDDFSPGSQQPGDSGPAVRASLFQDIYDGIWDTFKQSMDGRAEQ